MNTLDRLQNVRENFPLIENWCGFEIAFQSRISGMAGRNEPA